MTELPKALQERISAVEATADGRDFDRRCAVWMLVLGVALPGLFIALGAWWLS